MVHQHTNRLADETSPYLLQHAHNPVDWYPWGDEALERARQEDKPIFLSVGYSACHWCHVMERESFQDEAIARTLNAHFVCIKVDREERPDIDSIYMDAVQMMTGHGGWPMSVFLTPELRPFFSGTYFPPTDRWGRPGFASVLAQLIDVWDNERERVADVTERVTARLEAMATAGPTAAELGPRPIAQAFQQAWASFEATHGGFGGAPKFPPSQKLRLLLQVWSHRGVDRQRFERAREMVETTLVRMASGGIYDQIGGGFHRYSVDDRWLIPHFEKMLYDNAQLAVVYTEAWQAFGRNFYQRIARETLDYVLREMVQRHEPDRQPFSSSQDADSEGVEGKYFVWTPDQVRDALGEARGRRACEYWGIIEGGNFEHGTSAPNRLEALDDHAHNGAGIEAGFEPVPGAIDQLRRDLLEARQQRVAPATDTKVLAAWNGLMISAFARAGYAFDEPRYLEAAHRAADFVIDRMVDGALDGDFQLMRTHKDGRARFPGYLDDFANMAAALLDLFEATGQLRRLAQAERLVDRMLALFWDDDHAGFFYTAEHHRDLIVRQKEAVDTATPASNAVALDALLRLCVLRDRPGLRDRADEALRAFYSQMQRIPQAMAAMLRALDFHLGDPREIVLVSPTDADGEALRQVLRRAFVANGVRIDARLDQAPWSRWVDRVPLLQGRRPDAERTTAFVCEAGRCHQPVTDARSFRQQLNAPH